MSRPPLQLREDQIDQLVTAYQAGASLSGAAKPLGLTQWHTRRALEARGLEVRSLSACHRQYAVNEAFFDVIDTEEKAYWLGFLTADGNVFQDAKGSPAGLRLALARTDSVHLEKFKRSLESEHPIHDREIRRRGRTYYSSLLHISSRRLADQLAEKGVVPNKTFVVKPSPDVPWHLQRHYWRGCVDGDGSLLKNKSTGMWNFCLVGTKALVEGFRDFVESNDVPVTSSVCAFSSIWKIAFGGNQYVKDIASLLWDGATIFLDRKKAEYDRLMAAPVSIMEDWSYITKEDLLGLKRELRTWGRVHEFMGVSFNYLIEMKKKLGVPMQKTPFKSSSITGDELLEMYNDLGTWAAVAKSLGIFPNNMWMLKKRLNVPIESH